MKELILPDLALHGLTGPGGRPNGGLGGTSGGETAQSPPAPLEIFVNHKVSLFQFLMYKVCVMVGWHWFVPVSQGFVYYGWDIYRVMMIVAKDEPTTTH